MTFPVRLCSRPRDIVWNYGECGEVISGKKTSWSEVGSKAYREAAGE